jgi:putative long chain acyl-CoA synthase
VRGIHRAAPRAEIWERELRAGHFGLVVGSKAAEITWPGVAAWLDWREGRGGRPEGIVTREERSRARAARDREATTPAQLDDLRENAGLAVRLGRAAVGGVVGAVTDRARMIGRLAQTGLPQVARLARLARVRGRTRLSPGLVLAEQAAAHPGRTFFLFEGRAYSSPTPTGGSTRWSAGSFVGVRVGRRIGVFMRTRPSAIAVVTAASRLRRHPVMLRDGGPSREVALGGAASSPTRVCRGGGAAFGRRCSSSGGGAPRTLGPGLLDLERVDPAQVELPAWYEPNPGKAGDVAVILFSGSAESPRARQITNARWALAAFGAASTTALTFRDTVYCATPLYHPTGILVCVGSALAAGVRLAVAARFEPKTFWQEVRLYGATVVFYKGTMLRALVDAPFDPAERDHPVRIFAGSGMPRSIWKRVLARFAPVSVLELYTSTEARAALANLSGQKVGCVGRPFPGTAAVEVVAWDPARRTLALGPDGFARRCADGETGLLLARAGTSADAPERPLRGIFLKGDSWVSTSDLFRRDADGDHWIVDHVEDLIWTAAGPLPSIPIEDAVGDLDAVSLAVAYGVRLEGAAGEIPIVAVALRPGRELDVADLTRALEALPSTERPVAVRIVDEIPMTPGYRPQGPAPPRGLDPRASPASWLDAGAARTAGPTSRPRRLPANSAAIAIRVKCAVVASRSRPSAKRTDRMSAMTARTVARAPPPRAAAAPATPSIRPRRSRAAARASCPGTGSGPQLGQRDQVRLPDGVHDGPRTISASPSRGVRAMNGGEDVALGARTTDHQLGEDRLAGEVAVDGGAGHADGGDVLDARSAVAALVEQPGGGGDDHLAAEPRPLGSRRGLPPQGRAHSR